MNILYEVHTGLYVNMTNRCDCACTFCIRQNSEQVYGSGNLWLAYEPSVEEVIELLKGYDLSRYTEVVFCGYGEPTERIEDVAEVCRYIRRVSAVPIRINTNGLGSLNHGRDITPLFSGNFDAVNISLNTPDPERYNEITRNKYGIGAFYGLLDFTEKVKRFVPSVTMTTVSTILTKEEEERCRKICADLGVGYRIRAYEGGQDKK